MNRTYAPSRAHSLLPLLASISRELVERGAALARIEGRLLELSALSSHDVDMMRALAAEASIHRREIRACRAELERLGCTVVGTSPLTIRIPTREGPRRRSLVWRPGHSAHR